MVTATIEEIAQVALKGYPTKLIMKTHVQCKHCLKVFPLEIKLDKEKFV